LQNKRRDAAKEWVQVVGATKSDRKNGAKIMWLGNMGAKWVLL